MRYRSCHYLLYEQIFVRRYSHYAHTTKVRDEQGFFVKEMNIAPNSCVLNLCTFETRSRICAQIIQAVPSTWKMIQMRVGQNKR